MKSIARSALLSVFLVSGAAHAAPVTILDTYHGADDHGYGDVIGDVSKFGISSLDVDIVGAQMSVTVNTAFKSGNGLGSFASHTWDGNGIGFGDLFLSSTGWNPSGSAPYLGDDSTNGTLWDYGISLVDRYDGASTAAKLYSLDTTGGNTQVLTSNDFMKSAIFRDGQEIAVDTTAATWIRDLATDVTTAGGQVSFTFDISGTALAGASEIGLHWAMTCGNDTIEGAYAVPEPDVAALMLLALGLIGFGSYRARKTAGVDRMFDPRAGA